MCSLWNHQTMFLWKWNLLTVLCPGLFVSLTPFCAPFSCFWLAHTLLRVVPKMVGYQRWRRCSWKTYPLVKRYGVSCKSSLGLQNFKSPPTLAHQGPKIRDITAPDIVFPLYLVANRYKWKSAPCVYLYSISYLHGKFLFLLECNDYLS